MSRKGANFKNGYGFINNLDDENGLDWVNKEDLYSDSNLICVKMTFFNSSTGGTASKAITQPIDFIAERVPDSSSGG